MQTCGSGKSSWNQWTELRLAKSRILPGDINKIARHAQNNGLRREGRTEGRVKGCREIEPLTVGGLGMYRA